MKLKHRSIVCLLVFLGTAWGYAQPPTPALISGVEAFDIPGDRGKEIGITWDVSPLDTHAREYVLLRGESSEGPFEPLERFFADTRHQSDSPRVFGFSRKNKEKHFIAVDTPFVDGRPKQLYYRLTLVEGDTILAQSAEAVTALPKANWYAPHKTNNLILTILCCGFVLLSIHRASRNPNLFIRKLAGLEAIDEAIGRATEMGKPILYSTGYHDMDYVSTIASVNILSHVARKVADYDSRLIVPSKWSIAMTVCQEVVKEAYLNAGRPDAYNPADVWFIAGEQFSYTAAVDGVIVREKPAAIFFLGTFAAEALILAETGASTGAIQISGTDSTYQIPFFVVACDYCLIGEELYAASAYLSREPRLLGSLKGQDAGKMIVILALVIGNILLFAHEFLQNDLLLWVKRFFIPL